MLKSVHFAEGGLWCHSLDGVTNIGKMVILTSVCFAIQVKEEVLLSRGETEL